MNDYPRPRQEVEVSLDPPLEFHQAYTTTTSKITPTLFTTNTTSSSSSMDLINNSSNTIEIQCRAASKVRAVLTLIWKVAVAAAVLPLPSLVTTKMMF